MVFKYCKKCIGMRQFLPKSYEFPENCSDEEMNRYTKTSRCCDVCGAEE
jgi:hypothetical protein